MKRKLTKVGGTSIGVIIPPAILELCEVNPKKPELYEVDININDKKVILEFNEVIKK